MLSYFLHMTFAGVWSFVWHWGAGVAVIILCLAGIFFSEQIPLIGPWLGRERHWLWTVIIGTSLLLGGQYIGAHDANNRCTQQKIVVKETVVKEVTKTKTPASLAAPDPDNSPEN